MKSIAAAALLLSAATAAHAQDLWAVNSPDSRNTVAVSRQADGRLVWRVSRDAQQLLADSPLGIRRADQDFDARLTFVSVSPVRTIEEQYTMPFGKRKEHRVNGRERTIAFANPAGAKIEIVLRAHNDGVAFRYRFPESSQDMKTVVEERTGFHVPDGSTGWMLPQQEVQKYGPAYEDFFRQVPAGAASERPDGWSFPALFETRAGKWILLSESALDEHYCGSHLAQNAPGNVYRIKFPDPKEGLGVGKAEPESRLPWTLPWRVVVIGDGAGRIVESDLVNDLAPASRIADTSWIKPGRAAWSWWSKSDSPKHAEDLNRFTDLAAEMGWEYALVDANWNLMQTGTIEDVIAHAKAKNVWLVFWYNSGGPHNDVTEQPRDRMDKRDVRRAELQKLTAWGVKGVKVDFWHSDKQDRIRQYRELLEDAAEFQLLVNVHGCTIPRGWSREFPNLIGMEAVFGAEQYKFRDFYPAGAPRHNTILPFTRNVVGPMDFTPVTFSDAQYPHVTTYGHELALSVVFETGIQHFADSVEAYHALPDAVRTFLKEVPSAWDETRVLSGEPGKELVIARRNGQVWYVAGLNGQDVAGGATVNYRDFVGDGAWSIRIINDGSGDRQLRSEEQTLSRGTSGGIVLTMRAHGGFAMRLAPTSSAPPRN